MTDQDEHIKRLMRSALDDAFKLQIGHLYKLWLSNPAELDVQRGRTAKGAQNAIDVYRTAISVVENWEG
jgi:hypothetical protein